MSRFALKGNEDPIIPMCRMVTQTEYTDLPPKVIDYAKKSILDTIAVMIGGSAMEGIPAVVELVKEKGGKAESYIPFYGGKVPASEAALAMGPMARAMDMGDIHGEAGHPSEYTVPALLAATGLREKVSGVDFITAYVLGQEVDVRIGTAFKAISMGNPIGKSCSQHIFGSVAAVGKLLRLNQVEMENAEGIARCMTQPHNASMYRPVATLMVRVHHGFVCQDSINDCLLARKGITGPRVEVLVGPSGFLDLAKWETDPAVLTDRLGQDWQMLTVMMKAYSCCSLTHSAIWGVIDQMNKHGFTADEIKGIEIDVSPVARLVCQPEEEKWNPRTVPECQFSLPYVTAAAAYDGHVFLDSYTPQAMARKSVRGLMTRISVKEDPHLATFAIKLGITLKNGAKHLNEYSYAKGHPENPLTEKELIDKFKKCTRYAAYKLSGPVVDSVIDAVLNLEKVEDVVRDIILPLTPKD